MTIVLFAMAVNVNADEAKIERFNYYSRTYFGDFEKGRLKENVIEGFTVPQYDAVYKGAALTAVKGYYQSGQLKFLDTIVDNYIVKTEYYKLDGTVLFVKEYIRESGRLKKIKEHSNNPILHFMEFEEEYFYKADRIAVKNKLLWYSRFYKERKEEQLVCVEGEGYLNLKKQPVYFKKKMYQFITPDKFNTIEEAYTYNSKGLEESYRVVVDGHFEKASYIKEYDSKGYLREKNAYYDNKAVRFQETYDGNLYRVYQHKNGQTQLNHERTYKRIYKEVILYKDNEGYMEIWFEDERFITFGESHNNYQDFELNIYYFIDDNSDWYFSSFHIDYASKLPGKKEFLYYMK